MPLTTPQAVLIAATALIVAGGGFFWLSRSNEVANAYALAAADCENGFGAGRLRTLDSMYGEDARPKALAVELSLCALDDSVDRLKETQRALDALSP